MLEHLPGIAVGGTLIVTFLFLVLQEMTNGFHDTANAVAATIYSKSLRPFPTVLISGVFNFVGVLIGGTAIAFAMVHLLPTGVINGVDNLADVLYILGFIVTWLTTLPGAILFSFVISYLLHLGVIT